MRAGDAVGAGRNARARRFYEREGWALDGTVKSEPREDFTMDEVRYAIPL